MPTSTVGSGGRLCNQIIRNLVVSIIAKKNDLKVIYNNQYEYYTKQQLLGLDLFSGSNDYSTQINIDDNNILTYINQDIISNIGFNGNVYFSNKRMFYYFI